LPVLGKRDAMDIPSSMMRLRDFTNADFNEYMNNLEIGTNRNWKNLKFNSSFKRKKKANKKCKNGGEIRVRYRGSESND